MTRPGFRVEHDSMGEFEVPADALWGAQTQRAVDNFPVSGERIGRDLIGALGAIKGAAARVMRCELRSVEPDRFVLYARETRKAVPYTRAR